MVLFGILIPTPSSIKKIKEGYTPGIGYFNSGSDGVAI
jgi:hypothetical protein